jgi:hypothetical protein
VMEKVGVGAADLCSDRLEGNGGGALIKEQCPGGGDRSGAALILGQSFTLWKDY